MSRILKYNLFCILAFVHVSAYSQINEEINRVNAKLFTVKGSVYDNAEQKPVANVNIEVNGGSYTTTNLAGDFRIQVKSGDELIIKHKDFETVYYTIKDDERIKILVEEAKNYSKKQNIRKAEHSATSFTSLIDSANHNIKINPHKSLQFVADALEKNTSTKENAEAYETLADVYFKLKQYDLASANYRISLQNQTNEAVQLKLAKAFEFNKNYQESIQTYQSIKERKLSNYQKVELFEGLGDVYLKTKDFIKSIANYQKALAVSQKHLITPKITNINSKIADVYDASGSILEAQNFYSNSLNLAQQENKSRALKEKNKVADFRGRNQSYDSEIELRKEVIKDLEDIKTEGEASEKDAFLGEESPLTIQKQNYKIGNALILKNNLNDAIPYLEKSIEEAETENDLSVQKDATRKLSEVYRTIGDYTKALETYKNYAEVADKLYAKKEQEISQATRLGRDILEKQNRIASLETDKALTQSKIALSAERNKTQQIIIYSLIGGLILLLITAYFMYNAMRQQKVANNLLALKSLRTQMNPHFIFNALNSVNSFIANNDERTTNKYLSDFSMLMRSVLENSDEDFIELKKEIELLKLYTKLEHFRFKDKFDYTIYIDESVDVYTYKIPPMLIQPYIENAVWHGLRYKKEKGQLQISINKKNANEITITIADNGVGRKRSKQLKTTNQKKQNSKGMGNIKKRVAILNDMYKDKVDVFIDDLIAEDDTGTKVIVTIKKD